MHTKDMKSAYDLLEQVTSHVVPIIRKADSLNRVVPPKEYMNQIGIQERDKVEFYGVADEFIIIKKHHDTCILCGGSENLIPLDGHAKVPASAQKKICVDCISDFQQLNLDDYLGGDE